MKMHTKRIAPRKRSATTDANLTSKQIQAAIEKLQGEIAYYRQMSNNAQNDSYRERAMRAIDARHAIIHRLQQLPEYLPLLPIDIPPVHAASRNDFPKLKA